MIKFGIDKQKKKKKKPMEHSDLDIKWYQGPLLNVYYILAWSHVIDMHLSLSGTFHHHLLFTERETKL